VSNYPTVLSTSEVQKHYGTFGWRPNGSSAIVISDEWVVKNITTVYVPQLKGIPTYGGAFSGRVQWHKFGVEQLTRAWADVEKAGLLSRVHLWGGSFVPRRVRGGTSLSRHSWAIAFDINPNENGLGVHPPAIGKPGSVRELVPIFEAHGFCWGGRWGRADGMHFELTGPHNYECNEPVPDGKLVLNNAWEKALPIWIRDGIAYADIEEMAAQIGDTDVIESQEVPVGQYLRANGYRVTWNGEQRKIYAVKENP
jgi:hypothetical protein